MSPLCLYNDNLCAATTFFCICIYLLFPSWASFFSSSNITLSQASQYDSATYSTIRSYPRFDYIQYHIQYQTLTSCLSSTQSRQLLRSSPLSMVI